MELRSNRALGFSIALSPWTLLLAVIGYLVGTSIGALKGLGPSHGEARLIPTSLLKGLGAIPALVLLTSVYNGACMEGGSRRSC